MKSFFSVLLCLLLVQGCASVPVGDRTAQAIYEAMEDQLLSAPVLRVDYDVEAHGVITANITGDLVMQKPALAAISADGRFGMAAVAPRLVSDGSRLSGANGSTGFEQVLPDQLHEGLLIGLMRMGVLHNLAKLTQGAPPDGTDGTVRDWVVAHGFGSLSSTRLVDDVELRGIGFLIEVGGKPAGDVVIWYDPETGLPVERVQVVHFPDGDMHVSERYKIEIDGVIGPCRFDPGVISAATE